MEVQAGDAERRARQWRGMNRNDGDVPLELSQAGESRKLPQEISEWATEGTGDVL